MYIGEGRDVCHEKERMIDLSPISVPDLNRVWGSRGGEEGV